MSNLRFILYVFVALTISSGCRKDDDTTPVTPDPVTPEPTTIKHLKSITTIEANPKTTKYEWDDKNRGTKITYQNGVYSAYTFNGNTIGVKLYANDTDYFFNGTGTMTSAGAIDKITGTLTIDGINYPYSFDCDYNAEGQLIKSVEVENEKNSTYEYFWKDGNLIKRKEYENGVLYATVNFTYDNSINKSSFDIGTNFIETTLGTTGERSKNMMTHFSRTLAGNNTVTSNVTLTYVLDSEGYITKSTYADAVYSSNFQTQFNY